MINTIFHFINDPTFDYEAAVANGDISEYTIVFNAADRSICTKNSMYGRMSRADMAEVLGNMSDLLPVATNSSLGAIKIGYTSNTNEAARRYGVKLDESNKAYVEVPWTDTVTPVFDDTELKSLISVERNRINNFISTLGDTIDAKNRELYADTAWVNEVFGNPDLQGTVAHAYRTAVDNYLMGYAVWDWVDPNDHTKGRTAKISEMRQDLDGITSRVGTAEEWMEDADDLFEGIDGDIMVLQEQSSTLTQTAQAINLRVQEVESWNVAPNGIIVSNTTRIGDVEARAGRVELRAGQLETRMTDAEGRLTSTDIALSDLELSVNGYYSVSLVSATSEAIEISTIARDASKFDSLSEGQHINDKLFSHFPVQTSVYKNSTLYFKFTRVDGAVDSLASLSSSVTSYNGTNDNNLANLIKMASSVLQLKSSLDAQGYLTSIADLASVITNGSFTGYSGLSTKVQEIDGEYVSQSSLTSLIQALDVTGKIANATSGLANKEYVRTQASAAESNAKGYADNVAAAATSTMYATVDDVCAGIGVTVTKNTDGSYQSVSQISADNIYLNGNTWAQYIGVGQIVADTLTAGTATIKASLTVGGSNPSGGGSPGTITMKNSSDGTIGVWNRDRLAVGTTAYPDPSNSAMLVNANGSGSLAKGNISWDTNGSLTVYGNGYFNGVINASSGVFNGVVNATLFKAGDDNGFSITTSPDSLDFNYNGARLAFFSLRGWDSTNNQLADVADNPTGFYLYLTNPLDGHLITIDFTNLSFKDLNENQVVRHEATFYSLVNLYRRCLETLKILYYSIEEGVTKWWEHSDSSTELTSAQMGTLYKRMNGVARTNGNYHTCVQEVSSQSRSYWTTNVVVYEEYTLLNNVPTKTGNYAMVTHLNTDGTSSTDYYFVEPGYNRTLTSSNTNWNAAYSSNTNSTINSTTATTVVQTSNTSTVPTFTSAVSLISRIDENGNVVSILYPGPSL